MKRATVAAAVCFLLVTAFVILAWPEESAAKLRSLVLHVDDGVLVKCKAGEIVAVLDEPGQVYLWCHPVGALQPTITPDVVPPAPPTLTATDAPLSCRLWRIGPGTPVMDLADQLLPGDTIILNAGVHRSVDVYDLHGTADRPIIITGELTANGNFATFLSDGIQVRNCTHVIVKNLGTAGSVGERD